MTKQKPTLAFYTSSDDNYAPYAAISLLSIRQYRPDADLYLLSRQLSDQTKLFLTSKNINFIELDLSENFNQTWNYPIECYYIFAGPQIFNKKGYQYSMYIDGDILCLRDPLPELPLESITACAGVDVGTATGIFGDDIAELEKLFKLKQPHTRKRVNSGVVVFNNQKMDQLSLLESTSELFKTCLENSVPRKGDDSLFALFCLVYLDSEDMTFLPNIFNFIASVHPPTKSVLDNLIILHFVESLNKPWSKTAYHYRSLSDFEKYKPLTDSWRQQAQEILAGTEFEAKISPARATRLTSFIKSPRF